MNKKKTVIYLTSVIVTLCIFSGMLITLFSSKASDNQNEGTAIDSIHSYDESTVDEKKAVDTCKEFISQIATTKSDDDFKNVFKSFFSNELINDLDITNIDSDVISSTRNYLSTFTKTDNVFVSTSDEYYAVALDNYDAILDNGNNTYDNYVRLILILNKSYIINNIDFDDDIYLNSSDSEFIKCERIIYDNNNFIGTLNVPTNNNNAPVVIFCNDGFDSKEFIDAFTQKGIATFSYTANDIDNTLFHKLFPWLSDIRENDYISYYNAIEKAINTVSQNSSINNQEIYLMGINAYIGNFLPKLAESHNEVKGIIPIASTPRNLFDAYYSYYDCYDQYVDDTSYTDEEKENKLNEYTEKRNNLTNDTCKFINTLEIEETVANLSIPILAISSKEFMVHFKDYVYESNPEEYFYWKTLLSKKENCKAICYDYISSPEYRKDLINEITDFVLNNSR